MSDENTLHAAIVAACADMPMPVLDSVNPHFNSKFASLGSVLNSVRPALSAHGLALKQTTERRELERVMLTEVSDAQGNAETVCEMPVVLPPEPQKLGSVLTYSRRYSLLMAFGLVGEEDDDGNAASAQGVTGQCACGARYVFAGGEAQMKATKCPQCGKQSWRVV